MRKTAEKLVKAFKAGKSACCGNSSVAILRMKGSDRVDFATFSLHGHPIVTVAPDGKVSISFAGWPTVTTRSRINDICDGLIGERPVSQRAFGQYVYEKPVTSDNGEWYAVGNVND